MRRHYWIARCLWKRFKPSRPGLLAWFAAIRDGSAFAIPPKPGRRGVLSSSTELFGLPAQGAVMAEKSPSKNSQKKVGKSLKEKRLDKKAKASGSAANEIIASTKKG